MTILLGTILIATVLGLKISADALAVCLFLWLIAAVIEMHK